ncbi:hypothetical protein PR048_031072 [Dryococelus australis]|uniref:RNA-directed DNA polymerase n=1 Tax=Dryococelus australis TaxID=614101 RepID=A0ABQ9G503_9NEOP|nr:hypothetical protein PR048_031072 [Dryococelus australis]
MKLPCSVMHHNTPWMLFATEIQCRGKQLADASRRLTDSEKYYSQSEKELLAIYFATSKFHDFIYGHPVNVQTFGSRSPRLQQLRCKLLKYILNVYYVPGKDLHLADGMSRMPLPETKEDCDIVETVHSLSAHLPMSDARKPIFQKESSRDPVLSRVSKKHQGGWPAASKLPPECQAYCKVQNNLHVEDRMVFLGSKIVVPTALRPYVFNLAHEEHGDVEKTKARAKQVFYWSLMSTDIAQYVSRCWTCEKFQRTNRREPLIPHTIPRLPYLKVGADILEEAGNDYLVLID